MRTSTHGTQAHKNRRYLLLQSWEFALPSLDTVSGTVAGFCDNPLSSIIFYRVGLFGNAKANTPITPRDMAEKWNHEATKKFFILSCKN